MDVVYLCMLEHKHGIDAKAHQTKENAKQTARDWLRPIVSDDVPDEDLLDHTSGPEHQLYLQEAAVDSSDLVDHIDHEEPIVIDPSGRIESFEEDIELDTLQEAVGGLIEPIKVGDFILIMHEEGKLKGFEENPLATDFAQQHLRHQDRIVGPVVMMYAEEFV